MSGLSPPAPGSGAERTPVTPAGSAGEAPGVTGKPDQSLGRRRRITRTAQFREAYDQGRRWVGPAMVLWLRQGEDASLRLGVVAGRKVGGAVQRARAKRLLREAYRRNRHLFAGNVDVVLIARRRILDVTWDEVNRELMVLATRAGLLGAGVERQ